MDDCPLCGEIIFPDQDICDDCHEHLVRKAIETAKRRRQLRRARVAA